jgi:hypothetical protein
MTWSCEAGGGRTQGSPFVGLDAAKRLFTQAQQVEAVVLLSAPHSHCMVCALRARLVPPALLGC